MSQQGEGFTIREVVVPLLVTFLAIALLESEGEASGRELWVAAVGRFVMYTFLSFVVYLLTMPMRRQ